MSSLKVPVLSPAGGHDGWMYPQRFLDAAGVPWKAWGRGDDRAITRADVPDTAEGQVDHFWPAPEHVIAVLPEQIAQNVLRSHNPGGELLRRFPSDPFRAHDQYVTKVRASA